MPTPPAAPNKTRRVVSRLTAASTAAPARGSQPAEWLANDLAQLSVQKPTRPAAAPRQPAATRTTKAAPAPPPLKRTTTTSAARPAGLASLTTSASTRTPSASSRTTTATAASSSANAKASTSKLSSLPPFERAREHMKAVNSSLATLGEVNKSGWRASATAASPAPPSSARLKPVASCSSLSSASSAAGSRGKVDAAARACGEALHGLRCLIQEGAITHKPIQTEKAAGTLVANLVEMEMVCIPQAKGA